MGCAAYAGIEDIIIRATKDLRNIHRNRGLHQGIAHIFVHIQRMCCSTRHSKRMPPDTFKQWIAGGVAEDLGEPAVLELLID